MTTTTTIKIESESSAFGDDSSDVEKFSGTSDTDLDFQTSNSEGGADGSFAAASSSGAVTPADEMALIPQKIFFRIGEVAKLLQVKPSVLRFWETEFPFIHPTKSASGHRVYRRKEVEKLFTIKRLLYVERFSIEGAKKKMKELKKQETVKPEEYLGPQQLERLRTLVARPLSEIFKY